MRVPTLAIAAVLSVVASAAMAVVVLRGKEDHPPPPGAPKAVSAADLQSLAADSRRPIYWAGARPGVRYELTRTRRGKSFVRYLPDGVEVGDKRAAFLAVATYPQPRAYPVTERSSRRRGMRSESTAGGGLAVWSRKRPNNVYLAYPGRNQLIEVYSPDAGEGAAPGGRRPGRPVGEVSASEPAPRPLQR